MRSSSSQISLTSSKYSPAGSCSPSYYDYRYYSNPNVIYFGRRQAYREGYSFGHCR